MKKTELELAMDQMETLKKQLAELNKKVSPHKKQLKAQKLNALKTNHNFGAIYTIAETTHELTRDQIHTIVQGINPDTDTKTCKRGVDMALKYIDYITQAQSESGTIITRTEDGNYIATAV